MSDITAPDASRRQHALGLICWLTGRPCSWLCVTMATRSTGHAALYLFGLVHTGLYAEASPGQGTVLSMKEVYEL